MSVLVQDQRPTPSATPEPPEQVPRDSVTKSSENDLEVSTHSNESPKPIEAQQPTDVIPAPTSLSRPLPTSPAEHSSDNDKRPSKRVKIRLVSDERPPASPAPATMHSHSSSTLIAPTQEITPPVSASSSSANLGGSRTIKQPATSHLSASHLSTPPHDLTGSPSSSDREQGSSHTSLKTTRSNSVEVQISGSSSLSKSDPQRSRLTPHNLATSSHPALPDPQSRKLSEHRKFLDPSQKSNNPSSSNLSFTRSPHSSTPATLSAAGVAAVPARSASKHIAIDLTNEPDDPPAARPHALATSLKNKFTSSQQFLALQQAANRRQAEQNTLSPSLHERTRVSPAYSPSYPQASLLSASTSPIASIQGSTTARTHYPPPYPGSLYNHRPQSPYPVNGSQSAWSNEAQLTHTSPYSFQNHRSTYASLDEPPVCIGLLSSQVLILYPLQEFSTDVVGPDGRVRPQTLPVRLCRFPSDGTNENLKVLSPSGEQFGVVEHKIGNAIGPLLGPIHSISGGSTVGGWTPASQSLSHTQSGRRASEDDDEITEIDGMNGRKVIRPPVRPVYPAGRRLFIECCVIRRGENNPATLPLQLLVFCFPSDIPSVAFHLTRSGVVLEHPISYDPNLHLGCLYANPHSTQPRETTDSIRQRLLGNSFSNSVYPLSNSIHPASIYGGRPAQVVRTYDAHEQVDAIFEAMASGVDLDETEPSDSIVTPLYPHQKQALSFMLDRETLKILPEEPKAGQSTIDLKALETVDSQNVISLWKKHRDSKGRHVSWVNVATGMEQLGTETPTQCRGALLADDMGLGKTISVISLIAATIDQAAAFAAGVSAKSEPGTSDRKSPKSGSTYDNVTTNETGETSCSNPAPKPTQHDARKSANGPKPKKDSKTAIKKQDAINVRLSKVKVKSRATLIVCPLSTVQNWESQIEEHVRRRDSSSKSTSGNRSALSVYVYHGNQRTADAEILADHDVVITTYSLLGCEYSRQNRSTKEEDASSDDIEELDAAGHPTVPSAGNNVTNLVASKTSAKKKRKANTQPSPLQAIEWFRVVLDEAHMIKEYSTIQSKAARDLMAERRICLTGTPLQNSLNDIFSLICFLRLEPFTDRAFWMAHIGTPAKLGDRLGVSRLHLIMRHIALRRTKMSVDKFGKPILSLPPKKDEVITLELNDIERKFYLMYHQRSSKTFMTHEKADTLMKNYCSILQELLRLRQICNHMGLVLDAEAKKRLTADDADLGRSIELEGFSLPKAIRLLILMRDTGATQCCECAREVIPASTSDSIEDDDWKSITPAPKRGRKTNGANLKRKQKTTASNLADEIDVKDVQATLIVTKCQHLFCSDCWREQLPLPPPGYSDTLQNIDCSICSQQLSIGSDTFEITNAELEKGIQLEERRSQEELIHGGTKPSPEDSAKPQKSKSRRSRKSEAGTSNRTPGPPPEPAASPSVPPVEEEKPFIPQSITAPSPIAHSTKIMALLADLLPFSQANPASANYSPHNPLISQSHLNAREDAPYEPTLGLAVKSVVFSQWTKMLEKIASALDECKIVHGKLDGTMTRTDRSESMNVFKTDPKCEVLLVSLRAGGVGLNLTCAQRVYVMEPFWNPAVESQAVDRVHRLGQTKPVRMVRYIISGSVEENMLEIQKRKRDLANMSLGQTLSKAEIAKRRVDDLRTLFKDTMRRDDPKTESK